METYSSISKIFVNECPKNSGYGALYILYLNNYFLDIIVESNFCHNAIDNEKYNDYNL